MSPALATPEGNAISAESAINEINCLAGMALYLIFYLVNDRFFWQHILWKSEKPLSTPHLRHTTALLTDIFRLL
ncbi:MAG: hypothetical protein ACHBN1_31720 [Heteroscytonema crispum UTEX LB 1556]